MDASGSSGASGSGGGAGGLRPSIERSISSVLASYAAGSPTGNTPAMRFGAAVLSMHGKRANHIFMTLLSSAIGADAAPAGTT